MSRRSARAVRGARVAPVFAALGDETRLALVARLSAHGPQSIAKLTSGSALTRQAITKHLDVLGRAGLVRGAWRGRERIWDLDTTPLSDAQLYLDQISQRWDEALARLAAFVEE